MVVDELESHGDLKICEYIQNMSKNKTHLFSLVGASVGQE